MKFSANQQVLVKALNIVSKAVTARTTIPILKGILLRINENGILTMAASDLEINIEKKLKVEDSEPGEIVVQAKLFGDKFHSQYKRTEWKRTYPLCRIGI